MGTVLVTEGKMQTEQGICYCRELPLLWGTKEAGGMEQSVRLEQVKGMMGESTG